MKKTIAELIDELSVTNIKIFMLKDMALEGEISTLEAQKLQQLQNYRLELKNAINEELERRYD